MYRRPVPAPVAAEELFRTLANLTVPVRARPRTVGEWRNWQTRRIQVPVSERMWGFKSLLAHSGLPT